MHSANKTNQIVNLKQTHSHFFDKREVSRMMMINKAKFVIVVAVDDNDDIIKQNISSS